MSVPVEGEEDAAARPSPGTGVLIAAGDTSEAVRLAITNLKADMELEYEIEAEENKKKIHRGKFVTFLLTFLLTAVCFVTAYSLFQPFRSYLALFLPEETAAPEETVSFTTETREIIAHDPVYVAPHQDYTFSAQVLKTGTPRLNTTSSNYSTLQVTATLTDVLDPDYYARKYGSTFLLTGTEACAELTMSYTLAEGSNAMNTIVPQNAFELDVVTAEGIAILHYQLMDKLIQGAYNVQLEQGKAKKLYKRYEYGHEPVYLSLRYYLEGEIYEVRFALREGDPLVTYETLSAGDKGTRVQLLQEAMNEKGYRIQASGTYSARMETAVASAQEDLGLEATGVADDAFQHRMLDAAE